jgi:hypothetical protein
MIHLKSLRGLRHATAAEVTVILFVQLTLVGVLFSCKVHFTFIKHAFTYRSRGSSVSFMSDYGLDDRGSIPETIFPLASASRPALGPTQRPVQWIPEVLSAGIKRGRGVTLTTHTHLVPRLRMSRSYTSSHPECLHGV